MKKSIPPLNAWTLSIAMMLFCPPLCQAQTLALGKLPRQGNTSAQNATATRKVKDVLQDLRSHYQVDILFSDQLVAAYLVPANAVNLKNSLEANLKAILKPVGLDYKKAKDGSFLIKRNEAHGRTSYLPNLVVPVQLTNNQEAAVVAVRGVTGKVTSEAGEPLIGVTVVVKGTTNGTSTDATGSYALEVPDNGSILVFSYIGFMPKEVVVGNATTLNVTLAPDAKALEEVVVVGYGTQKKSDLTGAISSVSGKDLQEIPAANVLEQSQGRLAGVDIVKSDGAPGSPVQIRIRGNRSINASNEPLFVVDGIPTTANINNFNPNDIESVEVLKDASAVAIYGSRGANGVVLITTKKGKEGKAVISYDGYYGVKQPVENLNLMNGSEFAEYVRVSQGLAPNDNQQDAKFLSGLEIENLQNGTYTDWLDLALRNGAQQDHHLSVRGGSNNVKYYLSGSFFNEKGIIPQSDFSRYAFRANIEANLTKKLLVGISATTTSTINNQMTDAPFNDAIRFSPLIEPYDEDGNFVAFPNPREGLIPNPLLNYQPLQYVNETKGYRIFANIFGQYAFTPNLTYRLNFGPDYNSSRLGTYNGSLAGSINNASINNQIDFAYTLENILTYDKTIGDHALNVVGLFSTQKSRFETSGASGQDIPIEQSEFYDLGSAATVTGINSSLGDWGLLSYMGRVNYRLKDRYLFTVTGRADGSSRLAEGSKWAFFPAVSTGWIISEENFFKLPVLTFLKVRGGYGQVGNTSISPYQTLGGLSRTTYAYGNTQGFGLGQNLISNPDLKWEISKTVNVGLDFGLFNDRISGSVEYYVTNTDDLLLNRLIPSTSGYSSILQNIGATRNRGWEFTATSNVITSNSGFSWNVDLNVFSNKEEIVELFNGQDDDVGNRWFIGQPINVFYSFQQLGIWQTGEAVEAGKTGQKPGDIKIADVNGRNDEGQLTNRPDGVINADDRMVLGSTVPKWSGGLTNRFSYKGFDLSVLVYARQGQLLRSEYHNLDNNNWQGRYNSLNLDYWTSENPTNAYPLPKAGSAPLYADAVSYFDGSYVKIKNISLGYNFQNKLVSKLGLSSLRLYSTVNNAFTFSKFDWADPETSNGIVGGGTPLTTATYIFGINFQL